MKAVIMAGGQGTRLRPLTCNLPKPMVPILNLPVMEHIIRLLKEQGITEIAVTTFYLPRMIEEYFGGGEEWDVNLHYYVEETPLGTAGSVHNAEDFLDETFLVISGDAITDFDLQSGINFHYEQNAEATLVLSREEIPLEYGVVMTDDEGKIIRFLEKPNWGQVFSDTINTGIYILEPTIFDLFEKGVKFDFSKDLFPMMLEQGRRLYGLALDGYWNDIGNLQEYHNTHFDFLKGKINLPIQARQIDNNIWIEEGVEIDKSAKIKGPLYIGKETKVGKDVYLESSIIGRNNIIQPFSSLKQSITWNNSYIGSKAELRGTILASNVTLKDRVNIFDRTVLGRKVSVGEKVRIKPEVKIWPEKEIEAHSEIESSIVWSPVWSHQLFTDIGVVGVSNVDITPEFVAKLSAAYGSTVDKEKEVTVSADSYKISNALKRALIGGLQTAGINIVDLGDTITPVVRYGIDNLEIQGGVHVRVSYNDPQKVVIEFLNKRGANITSNTQKSIEKKFFAEDYRRAVLENIGEYSYVPEMSRGYLESVLEEINQEMIKRNYFSLVVDYEYDNLLNILPVFLNKLNCQILSTRNFSQTDLPLSIKKRLEVKERVGRIVRENKSDFGLIIDHNAEDLKLVNQRGEVLSKAQYRLLISYLLLEKGLKQLYLPQNAPRVIEDMAKSYRARVEYTPISFQVSMNKYLKNNRKEFSTFYPFSDGIYTLGLILEKMAADNLSFEELIARLPEFYLNNAEISCNWQDKGRVMRHLTENAGENTDLVDGVKFNHDDGWALVIPDSEEPVFHIYAEGQDAETAESLTGFYLNRVKELIGNNDT